MIVGVDEDAYMRLNPLHPGEHLKALVFRDPDFPEDQPGMTVGEAAAKIGVGRSNLSRVLNERGPVTLDLALKLEAIGWGTADGWLNFQLKWDLAQARKRRNQPRAAAPAVLAEKRMLAESAERRAAAA